MKPPTASLALEILKTKIDDADDIGRFISMHISGNKVEKRKLLIVIRYNKLRMWMY